jgi:hypothetical protein
MSIAAASAWRDLDLDLESLLDDNRKSLESLAAAQLTTASRTKNKKVLGRHRNMLAKPGFNVLMNRYGAVPHAPVGITTGAIKRLADPILGRFASYEKYDAAVSDFSMTSQSVGGSTGKSKADINSESSFFLTDVDDDSSSISQSSAAAKRDEVTGKLREILKVDSIKSPAGRHYVSNIFKELRTSKKKISTSVLSKRVPKTRLVHPADVRIQKLAAKLKIPLKTKVKLKKLGEPREGRDNRAWDDRACHGRVGRLTPKSILQGKPRVLLKLEDIPQQPVVSQVSQKYAATVHKISHSSRDELALTPTTSSLPDSSRSNATLPPLPSYSAKSHARQERDGTNFKTKVLEGLNLNGVATHSTMTVTQKRQKLRKGSLDPIDSFGDGVSEGSNASSTLAPSLHHQPSVRFPQQSSFRQQQQQEPVDQYSTGVLRRQPSSTSAAALPTLRKNNSKISPLEFASMRKSNSSGTFDFSQYDLEHQLGVHNNDWKSFKDTKDGSGKADIHVNKHDHSSRHAPWLLGTITDIDSRHKTAKHFAEKHLEELKLKPFQDAILSLILTPRLEGDGAWSGHDNKLSAFAINVALADAILDEAQAVNNFTLSQIKKQVSLPLIETCTEDDAPASVMPTTTTDLINSIDKETLQETICHLAAHPPIHGVEQPPDTTRSSGSICDTVGSTSTPRAATHRASSSTKTLFESLKLKPGVDDEMMSRIEKLAKRVEEHISLADFDPVAYSNNYSSKGSLHAKSLRARMDMSELDGDDDDNDDVG